MPTDENQQDAELKSRLSQLAGFFQADQTNSPPEKYQSCLEGLPKNEQIALKKLFRMLLKTNKRLQNHSDRQSPLASTSTPPSESSEPGQGSQAIISGSHEQTTDSPDDGDSDDGDSDNGDSDNGDKSSDSVGILQGTNFSQCTEETMRLSLSLNTVLTQCIEKPHHFFTTIKQDSVPVKGGFPAAFSRVHERERCHDLLRIHRRFDLHNLYSMAVMLGYHTGNKWNWGALDIIARDIFSTCPLLGLEATEIKKLSKHYVRIGRGYGRWIEHFGDPGYLIALPLNVTETE